MLWAVIRHGTRNPSRSEISRMETIKEIHRKFLESAEKNKENMHLCNDDFEAIKNWKWEDSVYDHADQLNEVGFKEMYEMGKKYLKTYPNFLDEPPDSKKYSFEHTLVQRTYDSMKMFVNGSFGENSTFSSTINNVTLLVFILD